SGRGISVQPPVGHSHLAFMPVERTGSGCDNEADRVAPRLKKFSQGVAMVALRLVLPLAFALALFLMAARPFAACASPEATTRARKFVEGHEAKLRALELAGNLAWWKPNITGKAEDFQRQEERQNRIEEA